jgi:hypothetical protein
MRGVRGLVLLDALAATAPSAAAPAEPAVQVAMSRRDCGCDGTEGPRSKAEWEKADYRWLGDGRLEMQAWASENPDYPINERVVMADWRDGELVLSHGFRTVNAPPGSDLFSCLSTVRLTYTVDGLPRGTYRVHASPARTITVEP